MWHALTAGVLGLLSIGLAAAETGLPLDEVTRKLDREAARRFVITALEEYIDEPSAEDLPDDNSNLGFFRFTGIDPGHKTRVVGIFSVSPWTGDVWSVKDQCARLSTTRLREMRTAIKTRFSVGELRYYAQLRNLEPPCVSEK